IAGQPARRGRSPGRRPRSPSPGGGWWCRAGRAGPGGSRRGGGRRGRRWRRGSPPRWPWSLRRRRRGGGGAGGGGWWWGGCEWGAGVGRGAEEGEACAEQVGEAGALLGVGVGGREVAALEQPGDGLGVLAVALGLVPVDGFHGPGVSQGEGDVVVAAGVGEPVPAVHALAGDEEPVAEGGDG